MKGKRRSQLAGHGEAGWCGGSVGLNHGWDQQIPNDSLSTRFYKILQARWLFEIGAEVVSEKFSTFFLSLSPLFLRTMWKLRNMISWKMGFFGTAADLKSVCIPLLRLVPCWGGMDRNFRRSVDANVDLAWPWSGFCCNSYLALAVLSLVCLEKPDFLSWLAFCGHHFWYPFTVV